MNAHFSLLAASCMLSVAQGANTLPACGATIRRAHYLKNTEGYPERHYLIRLPSHAVCTTGNPLPLVLLIDVGNDPRLDGWLEEATTLLSAQPPVARCALLSLLVSSWLGGHRLGDDDDPRKIFPEDPTPINPRRGNIFA